MSLRADAKGVFELGHDDVDCGSRGITSHQWLRQIGHHKTKLDQAEQNLCTRHINVLRLTCSSWKNECSSQRSEHYFAFHTHEASAVQMYENSYK